MPVNNQKQVTHMSDFCMSAILDHPLMEEHKLDVRLVHNPAKTLARAEMAKALDRMRVRRLSDRRDCG